MSVASGVMSVSNLSGELRPDPFSDESTQKDEFSELMPLCDSPAQTYSCLRHCFTS